MELSTYPDETGIYVPLRTAIECHYFNEIMLRTDGYPTPVDQMVDELPCMDRRNGPPAQWYTRIFVSDDYFHRTQGCIMAQITIIADLEWKFHELRDALEAWIANPVGYKKYYAQYGYPRTEEDPHLFINALMTNEI